MTQKKGDIVAEKISAGAATAAALAVSKPATATVRLLCNLDHDGVRHDEGAEVELPADVALRLVEGGAAETVTAG
jgi:hypothetical protein